MKCMGKRTQRASASWAAGVAILTVVLTLWDDPQGASAQWATSGNDIYNSNSGNVGIGTTGPIEKLQIHQDATWAASGTEGQVSIRGTTNTSNQLELGIDTTGNFGFIAAALLGSGWKNLALQPSGGNVGIGTTSPVQKLQVNQDATWAAAGNEGQLSIRGATNSNNQLELGVDTTGNFGFIAAALLGTGWKNLALQPSGGNVGIGTTTPTTKLHVVGDVTVTGNIAAKYQDVAEWVPASQPLIAGTVVVLDPQQAHEVRPSVQAYDTRVAGIVSDTPGLLLGEAGVGKVKVATTGRVKAKVDATRKPIQVGDLLVTSDKAGKAMASQPMAINGRQFHQPGSIVGKALEPLKEGEGEILVLLSLQ